MRATITIEGGLCRVRSSYNESLIADFKQIPGHRWSPTDRYWSFPTDCLAMVEEALTANGFTFDSTQRKPTPPPKSRPQPLRLSDCFPELFHSCPQDCRQRLHRALALAFHPDHHGGDGELMRAINKAYDLWRQP